MTIEDLPTDRDLNSTPLEHVADHLEIALRVNQVRGPFRIAHDTPGIDTGVALFTPEVGERIVGVWADFSAAFSATSEQIGIGQAGTTDGDLQFKFNVPVGSLPTPPATLTGVELGYGYPPLSTVMTATSEVPLVARTVVGSNTSGELDLYVVVWRSAA